MNDQAARSIVRVLVTVFTLCTAAAELAEAQDRLKLMPGYDNWLRVQQQLQQIRSQVVSGAVKLGSAGDGALAWSADGASLEYGWNGGSYRFDLRSGRLSQFPNVKAVVPPPRPGPVAAAGGCAAASGNPGVNAMIVASPDGRHNAIARNRNLFLADAACGNEEPITTDGADKERIRYGTLPWVYGEELRQDKAMWWNRSGTKLAYYRFDESQVPDFFITRNQTKLQTTLAVEAYPKAGGPNPIPDLFVYDLGTKRSVRIDVRDGKPFTNDVGHYVYAIEWSPDGNELLISRSNRHQNVTEFVACPAGTGPCRVIIREESSTGWVGDERSSLRYLSDSSRFIWTSARNGFRNYYLYDLTGKLIAPLTQHQFEVAGIVRVDEKTRTLWYLARDGDNFMKLQLHRVGLDGTNDRRLTDSTLNHQVDVSPDGRFFVDIAQAHDRAPFTQVVAVTSTRPVGQLAKSDYHKLDSLGFRSVEMFSFLAADGTTRLFGTISFPPNFDPSKKYPALMSVYGGPAAPGFANETFALPSGNTTPFGFIGVAVHTRASQGMGRRAHDALYMKLGQTEVDDVAAGVRSLWNRPYFDKAHVGIYGLSYGGYVSLMALLRYPDVFAAAIAMSAPTDWRNYDTIYSERYMRTPEENKEGYDKGSVMSYVNNLKGDLLIFYGTSDDNVHNNNSMQLIKALQGAGKHFEVQVGPDEGHTGPPLERALEFLVYSLVVKPMYRLP